MSSSDRPKIKASRKCSRLAENGDNSKSKTKTETTEEFESNQGPSSMALDLNGSSDSEIPTAQGSPVFELTRLHDEAYKIWKKNAEFLYDFLVTHQTEWPTLTVEWFPDVRRNTNREIVIHRLLTGTHAADRNQNHLIISRVDIPFYELSKITSKPSTISKSGYGVYAELQENMVKINHKGHVNRARYMPQNPFMIASKSSNSNVYIFDYTKQQSDPNPDSTSTPYACLAGHSKEGYGLSWNGNEEGLILSSAEDELICLWDINGSQEKGRIIKTKSEFRGHSGSVNDVQWHRLHPNVFGSAGDDKKLMLWDARDHHPTQVLNAHSEAINCLSFNPNSEFIFLSGSADKTVALWDLRNLGIKLHTFEGHRDEIYQIQWSPHAEAIFATCSPDKRLLVWDISKIGNEQSSNDATEGPPELMFIHGGHTSKMTDLSWSQSEPWMMASTSDDNILHIWKMIHHCYENVK